MKNKKILLVPGSIRKEAVANKVIKAFILQAPLDVEISIADISKLPLFNQDLESPEPDFLLDWKNQIKEVDAVLFVTPEYNRSIPPVLKNAIDWASRPPEGEKVWDGKPASIIGYSGYGSLGGFSAVQHLKQVISLLNMYVMQQPEFYMASAITKFNDLGELIDEKTKDHIKKFWPSFLGFIELVTK